MISSKQRRIVAVIVGVVLAAGCVFGFQYWLQRVVEQQGRHEVQLAAKRSVALADVRIGQVAARLNELAKAGVDSCGTKQIQALRHAAFDTSPLKELSIIGPDGKTACTDLGIPLGARTVLNPQTGSEGDILIEVVRFENRTGNLLQVRRVGHNGSGLAALIPTDLVALHMSNEGGPFNGYARVTTRDGTLIAQAGKPPAAGVPARDLFVAADRSSRYGISASVTMPVAKIVAASESFRTIGTVVTGLLGFVFIVLALLLSQRQHGDPLGEIRRALDANEFTPYYQPIVDITSARLLGAEVLVRWCKPDGSVVPPGAFIPLMEQSGLIVELTKNLMRRAREEMADVYSRRPHLKISFNLTAQHFLDEAIVGDIRDIFARSKFQLAQIVLELTERQPLENVTTTRRVIAALQELGCQVALDDVGTGHSGLSSILKLGVDVIKVDKIFVDSISTERNSAAIVETLVDLARHMRMDIIAEGVETFEQVADLRERGIRAAQGYVFAPPLPGPLFLQLLEASDPLPSEPRERHADMPHYISARNRIVAA